MIKASTVTEVQAHSIAADMVESLIGKVDFDDDVILENVEKDLYPDVVRCVYSAFGIKLPF